MAFGIFVLKPTPNVKPCPHCHQPMELEPMNEGILTYEDLWICLLKGEEPEWSEFCEHCDETVYVRLIINPDFKVPLEPHEKPIITYDCELRKPE